MADQWPVLRQDCRSLAGQTRHTPTLWNPRREKAIVHIDTTPAEVDASYTVAVGIIGDLSLALGELAVRTAPRQTVVLTRCSMHNRLHTITRRQGERWPDCI